MKYNNFDKSLFFNLQSIVLNKILIFSIFGAFFSGIINLFNNRPLINALSSFGVSILAVVLLILSKKHQNFIRLVFIIFFINFYIPFGWLTSPGSTSAFPYYSILLIMVSSLLIKNYIELFFPTFAIIEVLILLRYEGMNPDKFYQYTDRIYRINDLSMNFILVISITVYILFTINKYISKRDETLYNYSTTDQLTGLNNRRYLFDSLSVLHQNSLNTSEIFCIAMLDVNKFKFINDSFGHMVGDKVLLSIGNLLKNFYSEEIIVGRYGGDEFMLIFPKKNINEVNALISQLEGRFAILSKEFYDIDLTFSFGLSDNQDKSIEEMIHTADRHLYKKKNINISI